MDKVNFNPDIFGTVKELSAEVLADMEAFGGSYGEWQNDPEFEDVVAWTMFDSNSSDDNTVTIVLERENIHLTPSQSMVRITSHDKTAKITRRYLGIVTKGPFAEPDGLRADAPLIVTTTIKGTVFTPQYHGRCQVEIMGEEVDGQLVPPRFRPLPKSAVRVLTEAEAAMYMKVNGDILLGRASGYESIEVRIPSDKKSVLPRHTAILGTTGGGKSTTVSRLIFEAQKAGFTVIVLDVEGEYTHLATATKDPAMLKALEKRGQMPEGVKTPYLLHLVDRDCANPDYRLKRMFSLEFARLSPYAVAEILDLSEAQTDRFLKAYELTKKMLIELHVFPQKGHWEEEQRLWELDEFEEGFPRMTLSHLLDVVDCFVHRINNIPAKKGRGKEDEAELAPTNLHLHNSLFQQNLAKLMSYVAGENTSSAVSWYALKGKLSRLARLKVFDRDSREGEKVSPLDFTKMLAPGMVHIIDLSDTDSPALNNIVIADILRGVQQQQDENYRRWEEAQRKGEKYELPRVMIIIEEAHEFLGQGRNMNTLFQQVAKIAKRGRKRWLSLVFVTQLPQHLPRELLGLINNYILHKINDVGTISTLQRVIPGIDDSLWQRLAGLAPGQAIASFSHMARPLLVAVDPTPVALRMIE
jgi:hypothetical protein